MTMEKLRLYIRRTTEGLYISGEKASLSALIPDDSVFTLSKFGSDVLRVYTPEEWRQVMSWVNTPEKRRLIVPMLQYLEPVQKVGDEILLSPALSRKLPQETLYYLELPGMGINEAARFILGAEKLTTVVDMVLQLHTTE